MRFRHPDGSVVHLAYCTNVHPAEDVEGILAQLRLFAAQVRSLLEVPRLGIGLWISRRGGRRSGPQTRVSSSGCGRSSTGSGSRS